MILRRLLIKVLLFICITNNSVAANEDIINVLLIARKDIISASTDNNQIKVDMFKGTYFVLDKQDDFSRQDNDRLLLNNIEIYPGYERFTGWINMDDLVTIRDGKKVSNWPFKIWKANMFSAIGKVFEFNLDGSTKFYSIIEDASEPPQKRSGQVYLKGDIAIVKYKMRQFEYYLPFAIYDKANEKLCPLGRAFNRCDEYLNAKRGDYHDFYFEK